MATTFNGNPRATIISCYSPTNVSEETELVAFYDELSSLVCSIPKHNIQVIGGDMTAQIGKNRNNRYGLKPYIKLLVLAIQDTIPLWKQWLSSSNKRNLKKLIAMKHWNYSYDYYQTFTNESNFDIE